MKLLVPENYHSYCESQRERTRRSTKKIWASHLVIEEVARTIGKVAFGLCHGARTGLEAKWLRQLTGAHVIATDICEQPNSRVIRWDFHNTKPEWIEHFDFVYSNSLDHSFAPQFALSQWASCLRKDGWLIIEWSPDHDGEPTTADCFRASLKEYKRMVKKTVKLTDVLKIEDRHVILGRR